MRSSVEGFTGAEGGKAEAVAGADLDAQEFAEWLLALQLGLCEVVPDN